MAFHVQLYFPDHLNIYHASKLFTGLASLAQRGILHYSMSPRNPWRLDDLTVGMEITDQHQQHVRKVAFDLRDRSSVYCQGALTACDVYFKRSFVRPHLGSLGQAKVVPFGLNYPCRGHGSSFAVLRKQLSALCRLGLQSWRGNYARLRQKLADLRTYFATPAVDTFLQSPATSVRPAVLFQTRLWEPAEVYPDDPQEINETRAQLVRVLRQRLGKRFLGGVLPTEFARRYYPDVLTTLPTHRKHYLRLCKQTLIGVYSRGLHHSNAFKLSEYLAASQAIVSEPLTHELPAPLRAGTHFLPYHHVHECADQCAELLANPPLFQAMRLANHQYYCSEVEPAAHLLNCIRQTFDVDRHTQQIPHRPHFQARETTSTLIRQQ